MQEVDILNIWARIAPQYLQVIDDAPHNALYERPALLAMIGDVQGLRVLDLGSGSGFFAAALLERGAAAVSAFDGVGAMAEATTLRTGGKANVLVGDLREGLPLPSGGLDLIVASLVLHYLEDWSSLLADCRRALRRSGRMIISVGHPMADFEISPSGDYFRVERIEERWGTFGVDMPGYRRSLSAMIEAFEGAGFRLDESREPRPLPEMAVTKPKTYEKLLKRPNFLCLGFAVRA
jgi:SAM-dependent methyltransferase